MSYENPKYIDQNPGAFMEAFSTSFKEGQARLKEIEDRAKEREKETIAYNEKVGAMLDPYSAENATALAGINKSDATGKLAIIDAYKRFSANVQSIVKTGGTVEQWQEATESKQALTNLNIAKSTFEKTLQYNTDLEKKGDFSNTPGNIKNRQIASDYASGALTMHFDPETKSYVLKKEGSEEPAISLNNFVINKDFLKYDSKVDHSKFESDISKVVESKAQSMLQNIETTTNGGDKLRYLIIDPKKAVDSLTKDDTFTSYVKANASDIFYNTLSNSPSTQLLKPGEEGYEAQQDKITTEYATKVYSNNLSKPYASGAVTNVTQDARDAREKARLARLYKDTTPDKPTEAEINEETRNKIYAATELADDSAKVETLTKIAKVDAGWHKVVGKPTMLEKNGPGPKTFYDLKGKTAAQIKKKFKLY